MVSIVSNSHTANLNADAMQLQPVADMSGCMTIDLYFEVLQRSYCADIFAHQIVET